ncbi:hypothetical protein [Wohlfahrtiimonas chitiniclastica]|uniref:hypothetical protein n=1 Tax=Wohlfahrtiimonas chitiniclastica TaxID=400946 RepID=UPI001BCFCA76|nr:hypothetical protein [Wohlfahrtiimonas chitiniclastica]MBS7817472.1 hypothetical protein [Wohlfahrtiimonas chitiniclastica]MBS7823226.1 hypothetical protein [Wohlfahrtiimonas chitiniclastica]MBS7831025.1 hypothetical protein [Wohlfahrtiimonas chitiniclastica]MBS7832993.1 hypothetical protein [Wohlfahrtiimonas chitiniclastica]
MTKHEKAELLAVILKEHGMLISSRALWKIYGYPTPNAYRQARVRKLLPIEEFSLEGRRGKFILATDLVDWLLEIKQM